MCQLRRIGEPEARGLRALPARTAEDHTPVLSFKERQALLFAHLETLDVRCTIFSAPHGSALYSRIFYCDDLLRLFVKLQYRVAQVKPNVMYNNAAWPMHSRLPISDRALITRTPASALIGVGRASSR